MSRERKKGTGFENHVRDTHLRPIWGRVERSPLRGVHDFGDFINIGGRLTEAKKRNKWDLPAWIRGVLAKLSRAGKEDAEWEIVFAADKRSKINFDLVCAPAEQYFGYLLRIKQLEAMLDGTPYEKRTVA